MTTTADAIRAHGAQAVYDAASRHMAGDTARGLQSVGLVAISLGDVFRIQSEAYAELGEAARAIDYAKATSELERFAQKDRE